MTASRAVGFPFAPGRPRTLERANPSRSAIQVPMPRSHRGSMLASVITAAVRGVDSYLVKVEVGLTTGLPSFTVVGLAQGAVREGRFWPIEVKWTGQMRPKDLKQIRKYTNGVVWARTRQPRTWDGVPVEPLPLALARLDASASAAVLRP